MDPQMQHALLQDPRVQDAVRKAGQDALSDPQVQDMIMATVREKFPEYTGTAARKVSEWAHDPEVQQQACQYAGVAMVYAGQAAGLAGEQLVSLIEQGPAGIRTLAFAGGVASCVNAGRTVIDPGSLIGVPLMYILTLYIIAFSLTTMLFEAQTEWIEKVPALEGYQLLVLEKATFLSEALGRGVFYTFQGILWLAMNSSLTRPVELVLGLYLLGLGALHVAMYAGVMPSTMAKKMRGLATGAKEAGYSRLPGEALEDWTAEASPLLSAPAGTSASVAGAGGCAGDAGVSAGSREQDKARDKAEKPSGGGFLGGVLGGSHGLHGPSAPNAAPKAAPTDALGAGEPKAAAAPGEENPVAVFLAAPGAEGALELPFSDRVVDGAGGGEPSAVADQAPSRPASKKNCCVAM